MMNSPPRDKMMRPQKTKTKGREKPKRNKKQ